MESEHSPVLEALKLGQRTLWLSPDMVLVLEKETMQGDKAGEQTVWVGATVPQAENPWYGLSVFKFHLLNPESK